MKRREFVNFVGLGCIASSLPVAIAACSPGGTAEDAAEPAAVAVPDAEVPTADAPPATSTATSTDAAPAPASDATAAQAAGFTAVGSVADLDAAGFLASTTVAAAPVLIVRDPANANSVIAVDSTCTHSGCPVEWAATEFVCNCHGSKFSAQGAVTNGPAAKPLTPYEAKIEGDQVLVKAA
jgi:cytochrome b6-f complex iron-sulfur subunit